ncbi:MAG: hypothetical protein WBX25_29380 [Rhodomicrobium sp.]
MKSQIGIAFAILFALAARPAVFAQSSDSDVNAYIAKVPIAGLPGGPYAQWTEEQRKTAFQRVESFCRYVCVDRYTNASFPDKAAAMRAMAEAKVCLGACVFNHLPADYPNLSSVKQETLTDYNKARQLGSQVTWPLPR